MRVECFSWALESDPWACVLGHDLVVADWSCRRWGGGRGEGGGEARGGGIRGSAPAGMDVGSIHR